MNTKTPLYISLIFSVCISNVLFLLENKEKNQFIALIDY